MLGIAALAIAGIGGSFIAAPAQAAVTCTVFGLNYGNNYPTDANGNAANTHAYICANGTTVPSTSRAKGLFSAVSGAYAVNKSLPQPLKDRLKNENVKYFFFNNRADGDAYFAATGPYSGGMTGVISPPRPYVGAGGRCGNTGFGYNLIGQRFIAVAIYNNCNLDTLGTVIPNPSLEKTILHETGHAFDDTFSSFNDQAKVASLTSAFTDLRIKDVDALTTPRPGTPPAVWSSMNAAARDKHVCTLFAPNSNKPSQVEQDLGAKLYGGPPTVTLGQVCAVGSPNGTRYPFWVAQGNPPNANNDYNPGQIAATKLPYFLNNNQELFAELFVTEIYGTYGPPAFLQLTDGVLNNDAIATATPGYVRAFDCTRKVVTIFTTTLAKPTSSPAGCPTTGTF